MTISAPIVVGVDGSPASDTAVRWATRESSLRRCPLHLVHIQTLPVDYGPGITLIHFDYDSFRRIGDSIVADAEAIASAAAEDGVVVDTEVVDGSPVPLLQERAQNARMLVIGTRGHSAIKRGLLGSVSSTMARRSPCPVAIVPECDPSRESPVVVGVDGSECSTDAVRIAFQEACLRDVELVAIHCWTDYGRMLWRSQIQEEGSALLSENLAGYAAEHPDVPVRRLVTEQRPAKQLLIAAESAQLIVVGSHGRGGFAGMALGSTSQAVLHGAPIPLIIARTANTTR